MKIIRSFGKFLITDCGVLPNHPHVGGQQLRL